MPKPNENVASKNMAYEKQNAPVSTKISDFVLIFFGQLPLSLHNIMPVHVKFQIFQEVWQTFKTVMFRKQCTPFVGMQARQSFGARDHPELSGCPIERQVTDSIENQDRNKIERMQKLKHIYFRKSVFLFYFRWRYF